MRLEKTFKLKKMDSGRYPIIQGGMGVGISLCELASAVGKESGIGTISSAILDQLVAHRFGQQRFDTAKAVEMEAYATRKAAGICAINIMCALESTYEKSIEGAIRGGADIIISGAGLPTSLPSLVEKYAGKDHRTSLIPIVSSARALEIICKKWEHQKYVPDAVVLEGPKAGGHIGWSYDQVEKAGENFLQEYDLFEKLLPPVLETAKKYGGIPVIVAGGIYTHQDIEYALRQGASAVQMGTRFAATIESGASEEFKRAFLNAKKEDIVLAKKSFGSPCGLPFRYIKDSRLARKHETIDAGEEKNEGSFCICTSLLGAHGVKKDKGGRCPEGYVRRKDACSAEGKSDYDELITCGTEAYRVDRIMSVKELMDELKG